ncbi:alanine/glycine:cation symporter family protein [Sulfurospirillum halorespirans]|uniref:Sodium/alanine symporter n=1 Tax=Sulfurospirillum halorespirans DSM 13726 TaxID=1193502 RepID=A0A1D7TNW8_9BACT|nr:sodium:alanine symporter family protein [Sulfurospirillum halorespirans]AOO66698.1 sodium/alanine symporter [Sulfurospirillum halorespirans DSM 13726]
MEMIEKWVAILSGIVWGAPMLVLLVGTGIYLTIILKGMQFWALPHALKLIFHKEPDGEGEISHFAALMTALAATVGIGNIVGVATAITLGGPGAVFWMWMTGLVGMATKYSEAVLAVKYRQHSHHHGFKGGPMYYLTYGLNMPKLGMAFAIFTAIAAFGIGNMTQANAVAQILYTEMAIPTWITGVVLLTLTAVVILGGIKSIGNFTSFLVPFMILIYVSVSLVILAMNLDKLGGAFELIFYHAFNPIAAGGGFVGATMAAAIRYGVARGVFSNESGLGSAPIAAAAAKTNDPVRQALVSMTQTFIDTLVVCTMTALIILISPFWQQGISPSALTMQSFQLYLGSFGGVVVIISTVLFAYSTILGWSYYGEKAFEYIFGERFIRLYRVLFIAGVMVGSMLKLEFVWNFSDLTNGLMAIPNLIALLLLSKVISAESKRYFESLK